MVCELARTWASTLSVKWYVSFFSSFFKKQTVGSKTFLTVEMMKPGGTWEVKATDANWETM